jgi:hypothetical protein
MLKRRDVVVLPILAGATYAAGTLASRQGNELERRAVEGTIGEGNFAHLVLKSLRKTVSPDVMPEHTIGLIDLARRDFPWIMHPHTRIADFDRKLCTEFILNSNLIDFEYDIESYAFIEAAGACQPFIANV